MKKTMVVLIVILAVTMVLTGNLVAEMKEPLELELEWNFSKNLHLNLMSTTNLYTGYSVVGYRIRRAIPGNKFRDRTAEIVLTVPFTVAFSGFGHEGEHELACMENGAQDTSIRYESGYFQYNYTGDIDSGSEARVISAGLAWQNRSAEEVITRNLDREVPVSEILWFGVNQLCASNYAYMTKRVYGNRYGHDCGDIASWISWLSWTENFDPLTEEHLSDDVKLGADWQVVGSILPIYSGLSYWFAGREQKMPNWWFNTQFELTDVGVMYALSGWYQFENGIQAKFRHGYGKNRVEGRDMFSFEGEVSDIPLFRDITGGFRAGFSKTSEDAISAGLSLKKPLWKNMAVGLGANYYSGYHRNNPRANGSWAEIFTSLNIKF